MPGVGPGSLSIPLAWDGDVVSASDISAAPWLLKLRKRAFRRQRRALSGTVKGYKSYLHAEADVERSLQKAGWRIRKIGLITTQFYFANLVKAVRATQEKYIMANRYNNSPKNSQNYRTSRFGPLVRMKIQEKS